MGRCSGNALFGCKFQSSQQNFVCESCENRCVPLERCRFSEHFMFEGEDGNFLCRRPKIQMKKFPFVFGYYHLIVFSDGHEAQVGTDLVNARSRPKRFGLLPPREVLPKNLWKEGIPLTLKKQLHRLVPRGIARNDPLFIDPAPQIKEEKDLNIVKLCTNCRREFSDIDFSDNASLRKQHLPPIHPHARDPKPTPKKRLCVGVRIETPRNYDGTNSPSPNPSPMTPLSSVSIKVLSDIQSDEGKPQCFTFDDVQQRPDQRQSQIQESQQERVKRKELMIRQQFNRLSVNQTLPNKPIQMVSKNMSPVSGEGDSSTSLEMKAGDISGDVVMRTSPDGGSPPHQSPVTRPALKEIRVPPPGVAAGPGQYGMAHLSGFRSPDLGVVRPPDLVVPEVPPMDTTMIQFTMDLPNGVTAAMQEYPNGQGQDPPFWVDVTSSQNLRTFNAGFDAPQELIQNASVDPLSLSNFQSIFEAQFSSKRDLTPDLETQWWNSTASQKKPLKKHQLRCSCDALRQPC